MILLVLACTGTPLPEGCERYREAQPDTYGYCIAHGAPALPDAAAVDAVCPEAGRWEATCRQSWVVKQLAGPVTAELLEVCGGSAACALDALDVAPDPLLANQLHLCHRFAGDFTRDCVGHAFARWIATEPTDDEIATVRSYATTDAAALGAVLGLRVRCGGLGTCDGDDPAAQTCRQTVKSISNRPHACDGAWPAHSP